MGTACHRPNRQSEHQEHGGQCPQGICNGESERWEKYTHRSVARTAGAPKKGVHNAKAEIGNSKQDGGEDALPGKDGA